MIIILSYYYCRIPVDRDYKEMTEQDCSQMVTSFGRIDPISICDVATRPNSEVIVIDNHNSCVIVLDDKLSVLKVIGQGSGNSRLINPVGVAVTDNVIAVSDCGSHQVKKHTLPTGVVSVIGCRGDRNGQFNHPKGLAFSNNQSLLYVVDSNNYRIQVFQRDDTFAFSFGDRGNDAGEFQYPTAIAIDPINNVLVTDCDADCIHVFSHTGRFIQAINGDRPYAITISPTGYLITGHDGDDNKIRIWSPTYKLINQFGKKGSEQGEFKGITGMAVSSKGTVYVAERYNERLQVIS